MASAPAWLLGEAAVLLAAGWAAGLGWAGLGWAGLGGAGRGCDWLTAGRSGAGIGWLTCVKFMLPDPSKIRDHLTTSSFANQMF